MELRAALVLLIALTSGCYLSHGVSDDAGRRDARADTGVDAGRDAASPPIDFGPPPPLPDLGPLPPPVDGGPIGRLVVDCGLSDVYTPPGQPVSFGPVVMDPDPAPAYEWTLRTGRGGVDATLAAVGPTETLTSGTVGDYSVSLRIQDRWGSARACDYTVHVTNAPGAACSPHVVTTAVGAPVTLTATAFSSTSVTATRWTVGGGAPAGAHASFMPADALVTMFAADLPGMYEVELTVTDASGQTGGCHSYVEVANGPDAECPLWDLVVPVGTPAYLEATAAEGGAPLTVTWTQLDGPAGSSATVVMMGDDWTFTPDMVGGYHLQMTATDAMGRSASCQVEVDGVGGRADLRCPAEIDTRPGATVDLTATLVGFYGDMNRYDWTLVSAPSSSRHAAIDPAAAARTHFTPDVAGDYVLTVVTEGYAGSATCTTLVRAQGVERLRVVLTWNPPDHSCERHPEVRYCDDTNLDLHLASPVATSWFKPDDCYSANCQAPTVLDWSAPGPSDDPHLDADATDGFGPETTNVDAPASGVYRVGVHYYGSHGLPATADASVDVYCGASSTTPMASFGPVTLHDDSDDHDFWRVADVAIASGGCTVTPLHDAAGGPDVRTASDAMLRR